MKKAGLFILKYLLPLAITAGLLFYMFSKVHFSDMLDIIRRGVDWWWILLAMFISIFSHIFRAMRWQLQLKSLHINAPLMMLSCSVFGCYALNLLFPRLGEVWRCTFVAHREKAPFTTVLGSMVADRLADTVTVLLLTLLTFFVAADALTDFLTKYPVGRGIIDLFYNPWTWIFLSAALLAVALTYTYGKQTRPVKKIIQWCSQLWQGFADIAKMPHKLRFIILTLCIWGCYFIQLYVAFFAFDFTAALCKQSALAYGLIPCLVAFVLSSIGMAVPSNGGLGPWNIAVMFGLAIYGISESQGTAFSMLQWSGQTVMLILLGIFTMAYISLNKRKEKK